MVLINPLVMHIQGRFKRYLFLMRARMDLLRKYWDVEISRMIMGHVKNKSKTKKQKEQQTKLRDIKPEIKEAVL